MAKLCDLCTKGTSNVAQKDLVSRNGCYPIYGASGFIKNVDFYHQDKPYIAIVKDGAGVGRVMQLPAKSSVIGTMKYIIPNEGVNVNYLAYALEHMNLAKYYLGAAIPHIYFKDYCNEELPAHTAAEQNKIAISLDKVTELINLRKEQLVKLDQLVKSRFIELFGDIKTGDYKFETRKLGEVAEVGSSHRVFTTEFVEEGVPFYRGTEIGELANGLKPENPYRITKEHYDRLACDETKPKLGDLLMPSICNKGQVWMVDTDEPFYYKDGRVLCISPNRKLFNCKYLEQFMREKTLVEYPKLGSGSTFAEFKIFLLKDIEVLIPPIELQNQFATFVEQTDKSKLAIQQSLDKLETLKKSLMQEYFG